LGKIAPVTTWKEKLQDRASEIFSNSVSKEIKADKNMKSELYHQIGQLK
jgi:hypothetical protein